MSDKKVAFVTGANRGLGREFINQLTANGWVAVAGYRDEQNSTELLNYAKDEQNLHAVRVDVSNSGQIESVKKYIQDQFGRLDLLINNAGVNPGPKASLDQVALSDIATAMEINVHGVLETTRLCHSLLKQSISPKVVNIGSRAGLACYGRNKNIPYALSKSALNMLTKQQAEAYRDDKITVIVMTPGWVQTDMGGYDADLKPQESIAGMLQVIDKITLEDTGTFFDHAGERLNYE